MSNTANLTWHPDPQAEKGVEFGHLGEWPCFSVFKDRHIPKNDPKRWGVSCNLPGMPYDMGRFPSPDDAKKKAEEQATRWLKLAQQPVCTSSPQ